MDILITLSQKNVGQSALGAQVRKGAFNPMVISITMSPGDENGAQHLGCSGDLVRLGVLLVCECALGRWRKGKK